MPFSKESSVSKKLVLPYVEFIRKDIYEVNNTNNTKLLRFNIQFKISLHITERRISEICKDYMERLIIKIKVGVALVLLSTDI